MPGGPVKISAAGLRYWYTPRSITSASFSCSKIGLVVISDVPSVNTGSFALLLGRVSLLCHGGLGWRLFFNRGIGSNVVFSIIDGKACEMASAGQCGFIRRTKLLLVKFASLWKMPRSSPFLLEILPCPSGRPTSGMECNFSTSDNPNVAVRMPDKSIYLAGQGCLVHRTRPPRRDVGSYQCRADPLRSNTTGAQYLYSPGVSSAGFSRSIGSSGSFLSVHQPIPSPFDNRDG
jgi:hypothetical protein